MYGRGSRYLESWNVKQLGDNLLGIQGMDKKNNQDSSGVPFTTFAQPVHLGANIIV